MWMRMRRIMCYSTDFLFLFSEKGYREVSSMRVFWRKFCQKNIKSDAWEAMCAQIVFASTSPEADIPDRPSNFSLPNIPAPKLEIGCALTIHPYMCTHTYAQLFSSHSFWIRFGYWFYLVNISFRFCFLFRLNAMSYEWIRFFFAVIRSHQLYTKIETKNPSISVKQLNEKHSM